MFEDRYIVWNYLAADGYSTEEIKGITGLPEPVDEAEALCGGVDGTISPAVEPLALPALVDLVEAA